jgi:hypothetical protein
LEKISTWMHGAEHLLEAVPGVLSASFEGDPPSATEVRLLVEEDPPISQTLKAVRAALRANADEYPLGALLRVQVTSVGGEPPEPPRLRDEARQDPATVTRDRPGRSGIKLVAHRVNDVSPGVVGVELTLGVGDRRFAGGASGKADSPGRARLPALATLSALGSYVRFACEGRGGPTFALESVSEFSLGGSRVAVVVVTMSGHATPLIASWPLAGTHGPPVVRATLEATARSVTRPSLVGDRSPWEATDLVEVGEGSDRGAMLRQRAESLLESERAIASARIVLDGSEGLRVHVLATAELSRADVAERVKALLDEHSDLQVSMGQITVVQSRLSEEELDRVLGRTSPRTSVTKDVTHAPQAANVDLPEVVSRLTLVDLYVVSELGGSQDVGVRISGGGNTVEGRCQAQGGDLLLRALGEATLDAVGGLARRGRRRVSLALKDVRRFRRRGDEGVVVLVEAKADGRKTLLSGAAFSTDSFERASVVAVLQATNAFVAGDLEIPQADRPRTGSTGPRDRFPQNPSDSSTPSDSSLPSDPSMPSGSSTPLESPRPSDSPRPTDWWGRRDRRVASRSPTLSDSAKSPAPDDYVSQVLSRIQSTTRGLRRRPPPQD